MDFNEEYGKYGIKKLEDSYKVASETLTLMARKVERLQSKQMDELDLISYHGSVIRCVRLRNSAEHEYWKVNSLIPVIVNLCFKNLANFEMFLDTTNVKLITNAKAFEVEESSLADDGLKEDPQA